MDTKDLYNMFKTAIEKEQFAQRFYEEMIAAADDPEMKKILNIFLGQEKYHEEKLTEMYTDLKLKVIEKENNRK